MISATVKSKSNAKVLVPGVLTPLTLTGRPAVELNSRIAVPRVRRNFVLTKVSRAFCFISLVEW